MRYRRIANLVAIAAALLCTLPVTAQSRSWRIADFHAEVSVQKDGSADVSEQITFVFIGHFNGIRRWIPIEYPGPNGTNYSLFLHVNNVTDENGTDLKYESNVQGSSGMQYRVLKIYIPGADDTTKKLRIRYHVTNGAKYFDDHDEFYWNVTGVGWSVPIDAASVTVAFPADATGKLQARAYVGPYGSREHAPAEVQGTRITSEIQNPLSEHEGLTIAVRMDKGVITEPSSFTRAMWFLRSNAIVALPLVCFAVMFPLWWFKGRDPDAGISVAPQYGPPENMTPAEVGTLIDDSTDPRDVNSILVDLAVRGYLKIVEETNTTLGIFKTHDYSFQKVKPESEWASLAPFERELLEGVFSVSTDGTTSKLSDLRNHFYTSLPTIRSQVMDALKQKGMYYVDPSAAKGYWVLGGVLIVIPFLLLHYLTNLDFFASPLWAVLSIAVTLVIFFIFGHYMTAKSLRGARALVHIKGFQEFMNRVDADRLKRMSPQDLSSTFEKFLPFAMALGVEHRWSKAFKGLLQQPPDWYQGSGYYSNGYFDPYVFTHSLGDMGNTASQAFASSPRASSSSSAWSGDGGGFGDSGFSGGGFGGGGGDAF